MRSLARCNLGRIVDHRELPTRWEGGASLNTTVSINFSVWRNNLIVETRASSSSISNFSNVLESRKSYHWPLKVHLGESSGSLGNSINTSVSSFIKTHLRSLNSVQSKQGAWTNQRPTWKRESECRNCFTIQVAGTNVKLQWWNTGLTSHWLYQKQKFLNASVIPVEYQNH